MTDPSNPTPLQTARIMTLAMLAGPTLFMGVALLITFTGTPSSDAADIDFTFFLSLCLGLWAAMNLATSPLISIVRKGMTPGNAKQKYLTGHILRMALAEGPALLSIVGLFLFGPKVNLKETPEIALFLFPYVTLLFTGLRHFPSEQNIKDVIQGSLQQ